MEDGQTKTLRSCDGSSWIYHKEVNAQGRKWRCIGGGRCKKGARRENSVEPVPSGIPAAGVLGDSRTDFDQYSVKQLPADPNGTELRHVWDAIRCEKQHRKALGSNIFCNKTVTLSMSTIGHSRAI